MSAFTNIVKNAGWIFLGIAAGVVSALASIPLLIANIGSEKFGFLTICFAAIGYLGLFDFGVGRALTYLVAKNESVDQKQNVYSLISTGLITSFVLSMVIACAVLMSKSYYVNLLNITNTALKQDVNLATIILATTIPIAIISTAVRGILEGMQKFKEISKTIIPSNILIYLAPVAVSYQTTEIASLMLSILVVRIYTLAHLTMVFHRSNVDFRFTMITKRKIFEIFEIGGWMTVSNIISPLMVNMDRLVIGAKLPLSSVTYYAIPYEMVSRVLAIPSAITNATFPEFAKASNTFQSKAEVPRIFYRTLLLIVWLLVPLCVILYMFAHKILSFWISEEFAEKSWEIMQLFAISIFINGVAYVPYHYIQSVGRSDITAKFHIIEFSIYVPALYILLDNFGVMGAAYCWLLRVIIDCFLLQIYAHRHLKSLSVYT